jgi:hypothetical protein
MNWSAADVAEVPTGVVTVTSTVPAVPEGLIAVICVDELTVKLVAAVPPKSTALVLVKLLPVTTTEVPPAVGPAVGLTEETFANPS